MKPERVEFIMENLSRTERDEFLKEILSLKNQNNDIKGIVNGWEAAADINSTPRIKNKIIRRSRALDRFLTQVGHA